MTREKKLYLARAGRNGEDEEHAIENNLAIIGFRAVPSLDKVRDYPDVSRIVTEHYPDKKPRAIGNFAGQLWAFSLAMQEGDLVVLPRKLSSQIAIGRVSGPYEYMKIGDEYRHTRPVEWIRPDVSRTVFEQDLLYSFGAFMTVCEISRNDALRRVEAVLNGYPDPGYTSMPDTQTKKAPAVEDGEVTEIPNLSQFAFGLAPVPQH